MKQTKLPFSRKIVPDLSDPSFSEDESDSEGMVSEYESADEDDAFEEEQEVPESATGEPSAFNKELITKIAENLDCKAYEIYRNTLGRMNWSEYASPSLSKELLSEKMNQLCRLVIRNMTLKELLTVAVSNKRYLETFATGKRLKRTRERKTNAYTMFLRDYHKNHADIPIRDRFKLCHEAYKQISESELQQYADLAEKANLVRETNLGVAKENGKANKLPRTVGASLKTTPKDNMDIFIVNSAEYFAEDRKKTHGTEKSSAVKLAYAALSDKDRAKLIYRILRSVENKLNTRPVLCKPDQDFLNSYERRPQLPGTAYNVFFSEKSSDPKLANLPQRVRASMVGGMWRQLDASSKSVYERRFAKIKAEYDKNYQKFLENLPDFRRAQEKAPKKRKRRASVGEMPEEIVVEAATPAKRRVRSKTIDCSSALKKEDFLEHYSEPVPTSAKAKKRKGESSYGNGESDERDLEEVSPKKAKKKKKKVPETPPPVFTPSKSPKKDKKKKETKTKVPEPVKPPGSVKEYFKTVIYSGDPDKARKAYKKLTLEEKQQYHKELNVISEKYVADLNTYLKSLSKEELAQFAERNNNSD